MTTNKQRLLAIDGIEQRLKEYANADKTHIINMSRQGRDRIKKKYEQAVWIDSQLNGSCIVDPFFEFYFYEEADAVAFKLRWM